MLKTLSYRSVAVLVTVVVAYLLTGKLILSLKVGLIDTVLKVGVFFLHERLWAKISYGRLPRL